LIDTSAWVEFFRGRGAVADQVDEAIDANTAMVKPGIDLHLVS
jgi:hypothetical protein